MSKTCSPLVLSEYLLCTEIVFDIQNNFCIQHVLPMFCKKKSFWQKFTCKTKFISYISVSTHLWYCRVSKLFGGGQRHYSAVVKSIFSKPWACCYLRKFEVKITADDPMAVNRCWLQNSGPLLLLCSVIFAEIKCTGQVALSKRPINYISRNTYCLVTCLNL